MTVQKEEEDHGLEVLPDIINIDLTHVIDIIEVHQETRTEDVTTVVNQEKDIIKRIQNEITEALVTIGINQIIIIKTNSRIILGRLQGQI
jgi:hypothetical protein